MAHRPDDGKQLQSASTGAFNQTWEWWREFITSWNGVTFLSPLQLLPSTEMVADTDLGRTSRGRGPQYRHSGKVAQRRFPAVYKDAKGESSFSVMLPSSSSISKILSQAQAGRPPTGQQHARDHNRVAAVRGSPVRPHLFDLTLLRPNRLNFWG